MYLVHMYPFGGFSVSLGLVGKKSVYELKCSRVLWIYSWDPLTKRILHTFTYDQPDSTKLCNQIIYIYTLKNAVCLYASLCISQKYLWQYIGRGNPFTILVHDGNL